ncbi:MAG: C1 family peptidase [Paludibacteraceae bacterium]|nr:C1 family peptidase [Paludibacteraceae bacterium]
MSKFRSKILLCLLIPCLTFSSCDEETANDVLAIVDEILNLFMGYDMEDEDIDDQEKAEDETDAVVTERYVNWEAKCPPVGNQGEYGTCVAWASAYCFKTTLNVIDGKWNDPSQASQQCSPVDLWHLLPSSGTNAKARNCDGSTFEPAFDVMINKGVATMSSVPFKYNGKSMKMNCDASGVGNSSNKLAEYRVVAYSAAYGGKAYGMTVNNIKYYLKKGPLVIGAQLGNRFMKWNSSAVLDYDDDTYNGQHAYHAIALVGYDDDKKAFRVRNSWGTEDWGDKGSIWIGYDFFIKQFCFGVWTASNTAGSLSAASLPSSSNDVKVAVVSDKKLANGKREVRYTIENKGASAISTADYPISYIMFKAKHLAMRYVVMDKAADVVIAPNTKVELSYEYDIPADADGGKYYMLLIADPTNEIGDRNRNDNFFFVTGENGSPLNMTADRQFNIPAQIKEVRSLVSDADRNAYRNSEIEYSLQKAASKK